MTVALIGGVRSAVVASLAGRRVLIEGAVFFEGDFAFPQSGAVPPPPRVSCRTPSASAYALAGRGRTKLATNLTTPFSWPVGARPPSPGGGRAAGAGIA